MNFLKATSSDLSPVSAVNGLTGLTHGDGHERHGVIAEDVDHLHGDRVAPRRPVNVRRRRELQFSLLACPEALPLVLEDVGAGPAILKLGGGKFQLALWRLLSGQVALDC